METLVHLIYIHGFQGDDTSFQAFPLHLQEKLSSSVPPELNIRFQSSLYPTYKSVKPLSFATKNFLQWLTTQPDGPVILLGHSMGGLLAAEAATHLSSPRNAEHPGLKQKRVAGMIAFDTPFLGMHPHVVVSGIASLLPKDEDGGDNSGGQKTTEREMNRHPAINVVSPKVTDEWEDFKSQIDTKRQPYSPTVDGSHLSVASFPTASSSSSTHSEESWIESWRQRSPTPIFSKAADFLASHSKQDDPVVRWLRKHADHPLSASKRWVVERFQFGSCMFDPYGLKERYSNLVEWNGRWINYWTYTTDRSDRHPGDSKSIASSRQAEAEQLDNDIALLDSGMYDTTTKAPNPDISGSTSDTEVSAPSRRKRDLLRKKRQSDLEKTKAKPTKRHFVVLPTGLGRVFGGLENWEQVAIAGVTDEVEAHTGLFIPQHNLDYANFVDKVADRVMDCILILILGILSRYLEISLAW
ncbi:hypothetical protein EST38_g6175 [Candolleomyces aberdarensis]|uniref:Thioesterase domain-containing protein n=1 Tax=Candolleomyces aberdarensis TaxID=2316362 RepID=A0A4Q2DIP1_9AGAR|nr:hypothetical protein EST38_g6175 [Candolleomyces aberdarensis]